MFHDFADFIQALKKQPKKQRLSFCLEQCDYLKGNLSHYRDCVLIFRLLNGKEAATLTNALGEAMQHVIHDANEFHQVFSMFSTKKAEKFFNATNMTLPAIYSSASLKNVMSVLPPKQRNSHYEAVKATLPSLIKTMDDLRDILQTLNAEQRVAVILGVAERLPVLIQSFDDLITVLPDVDKQQQLILLKTLSNQLPEWIDDNEEIRIKNIKNELIRYGKRYDPFTKSNAPTGLRFARLMNLLDDAGRDIVITATWERLVTCFDIRECYPTVFPFLNQAQCEIFLADWAKKVNKDALSNEAYDKWLSSTIPWESPLGHILASLSDDGCADMCDVFKPIMQLLRPYTLANLLKPLSAEKRNIVYNTVLKDAWGTIFMLCTPIDVSSFFEDIGIVVPYLTPEQCRDMMRTVIAIPHHLDSYLIDFRVSSLVNEHVSIDQAKAVMDALLERHPMCRGCIKESTHLFNTSPFVSIALIEKYPSDVVAMLKKWRQSAKLNQSLAQALAERRDIDPHQLQRIAQAFRRIYSAVNASWEGMFKPSDHLFEPMSDDDWHVACCAMIRSQENLQSVAAKVWRLAIKHVNQCDLNNRELRASLASISNQHSNFFHHSNITTRVSNGEQAVYLGEKVIAAFR